MEETTIGAVLFDGIEENPYLNELYDAILYNYGRQLFGLTNLPEKEISVPAALRFADILSKSVHTQNEETHKLWAQEIVALLNALRPDDELIQYYLGSVLTSVSNFRGVSLKAADYVSETSLTESSPRSARNTCASRKQRMSISSALKRKYTRSLTNRTSVIQPPHRWGNHIS